MGILQIITTYILKIQKPVKFLTLVQAAAAGIGTLGKIAGATLGVATAAKPLILLGLGKCKFKSFPKIMCFYLQPN